MLILRLRGVTSKNAASWWSALGWHGDLGESGSLNLLQVDSASLPSPKALRRQAPENFYPSDTRQAQLEGQAQCHILAFRVTSQLEPRLWGWIQAHTNFVPTLPPVFLALENHFQVLSLSFLSSRGIIIRPR